MERTERTAPVRAKQSRSRKGGIWERQFVDDLMAADRLKTFLLTQAVDLPPEVVHGLASLSDRFREELQEFTEDERKRWRRHPLLQKLAWWRVP